MKKSKIIVIIGVVLALTLLLLPVFTIAFVTYPIYTKFLPLEQIIAMYQNINPNVDGLLQALVWFNMPFTFLKGMCSVIITAFIYKPLSPIIKGSHH